MRDEHRAPRAVTRTPSPGVAVSNKSRSLRSASRRNAERRRSVNFGLGPSYWSKGPSYPVLADPTRTPRERTRRRRTAITDANESEGGGQMQTEIGAYAPAGGVWRREADLSPLTLNQRVQDSSPCAPTIEIEDLRHSPRTLNVVEPGVNAVGSFGHWRRRRAGRVGTDGGAAAGRSARLPARRQASRPATKASGLSTMMRRSASGICA